MDIEINKNLGLYTDKKFGCCLELLKGLKFSLIKENLSLEERQVVFQLLAACFQKLKYNHKIVMLQQYYMSEVAQKERATLCQIFMQIPRQKRYAYRVSARRSLQRLILKKGDEKVFELLKIKRYFNAFTLNQFCILVQTYILLLKTEQPPQHLTLEKAMEAYLYIMAKAMKVDEVPLLTKRLGLDEYAKSFVDTLLKAYPNKRKKTFPKWVIWKNK